MSITTITLPNGVRIETTSDDMSTFGALLAQPAPQQPKAVRSAHTAPVEPKPEVKPTRRTTPKASVKPAAIPKGMTGKELWASITAAVQNGLYDEARSLAAHKPDTFGVQAEAAITRHMARTAKPSTTPKAQPEPKAEKPAPAPKERPMKDSPVLDKVQPEPTKAEKRAAKAQKAAVEAKPRNHKPDCGCVTCPNGVAVRKAAAAAAPKETAKPSTKAPKAPKVPQPTAIQVRDDAAEQREADRIVAKGVEQADRMLKHLDTDGLKEAIANYNALAKRNLRLGNEALAIAYDDALDSCSLALTLATEQMAAITK